ncbi:MAG TPA: Mpo1-like protein [Steroidobacteraceae bacterium]|nr:Mpo1-like protein [Steroidobacteraceae bacterium]
MRSAAEWLDEYAESHQNRTNKLLHWICVPAIVVSVIGLLWSLPVPAAFEKISPALNWGTATLAVAVAYYLRLSPRLALGMVPVVLAVAAIVAWLDGLPAPLWQICAGLFVAAWIGQFIGHHFEGRKPSFFKDVQFLMIGPLWLLGNLYRRFGISF